MTMEKIPLAGVIGSPIAHSRSPQIHMHWVKAMGLPGHYIPLDVNPNDLADVVHTLPRMGFVGANVTIPHKEAILKIADHITDRATLIGAANTLTFTGDGEIHADNTDGVGFIENLRLGAPEWDPHSSPTAVLGAGGASRAVVTALLEAGVPEIFLSNRTRARAEALQTEFGPRITVVDWVEAKDVIVDVQLLVNTTSLGMTGKPPLEVSLDGLRPGTIVNDLVYAPLNTELLLEAERRRCVSVDGLGMLLHQAVPGFERWFGQRPKVDAATRAAALR